MIQSMELEHLKGRTIHMKGLGKMEKCMVLAKANGKMIKECS
jgi:hypothetical protein